MLIRQGSENKLSDVRFSCLQTFLYSRSTQTSKPTQPNAQISVAADGFGTSSLNNSGAKYLSVPVCADVVIIPVCPSSRRIWTKPKSHILGLPWSSMRILPYTKGSISAPLQTSNNVVSLVWYRHVLWWEFAHEGSTLQTRLLSTRFIA